MIQKSDMTILKIAECNAGKDGKVLTVDIAAGKALAIAVATGRRQILPLGEAHGRVVCEQVNAASSVPPFDNSAMDGFAVSSQSFRGTGPWQLTITDRIVAGENPNRDIAPGEAARIMTGAPMPEGTDTVIMQEHCIRQENSIIVAQKPVCGRHVRLAGEDVAKGNMLLKRGTHLNSAKLALLAAAGIGRVDVFGKVSVGLMSTGSELLEPGEQMVPGKIYNSNRHYLLSRLNHPWIEIIDYGIVSDDADAIRKLVRKAAAECDILISTGGVSVGEEDHMLDVLAKENAELEVLKVAMRPGKPVTVGKLGKTLYFGLPGNPYAAAVTFEKIAWQAILAAGGSAAKAFEPIHAISGFDLNRKPGRTEYVPVTWSETDQYGRPIVRRLGRGSSASLLPLAEARGLATLSPDHAAISKGDLLQVECIEQ